MEATPLSVILDVVILVLLGATIVYAARLSMQLQRLRNSKSDLDKLIRDLVKTIDQAERAVDGLHDTARGVGGDLQKAIDRAKLMSDDLELVTDSGDKLASKLEALMDQARPIANAKPAAQVAAEPQTKYAQHLRKLEQPVEDKQMGTAFTIRDADVERGGNPLDLSGDDLYSEAERDLFRAMKGLQSK
jgi:ABC-type transporter Mla subunit MlaD